MSRLPFVLIGVVLGCSEVREVEVTPQSNFEIMRTRVDRGAWPSSVRSKAAVMVANCCPMREPEIPLPEREASCRELQRIIENDFTGSGSPNDDAFSNWGPRCYREIPTASLIPLLEHRRGSVLPLFAKMNPSAEATAAIFESLAKEDVANDIDLQRRDDLQPAVDELALGGERELTIVANELTSSDHRRRHWAAYVLMEASRNPLTLPSAFETLKTLAKEQHLTGKHASDAVKLYEKWRTTDPDLVAATAARVPRTTAIRLLGRRSFFCPSFVATAMLETYRSDSDPTVALLADTTIRLRAERCGSSLATKPRPRDPMELMH